MMIYEGIEVEGHHSAIREGWKLGMLTDTEVWLDIYEKIKMTAHNYDESASMEVYRLIREEYTSLLMDFDDLLTGKNVKL